MVEGFVNITLAELHHVAGEGGESMAGLIELEFRDADSLADCFQTLVEIRIQLLKTRISVVEVEYTTGSGVLLHQRLDERMNLDLDVGIITTAILRLRTIVLDNAFLHCFCVIQVG